MQSSKQGKLHFTMLVTECGVQNQTYGLCRILFVMQDVKCQVHDECPLNKLLHRNSHANTQGCSLHSCWICHTAPNGYWHAGFDDYV